jgi:hypothetical protein
MVKTRLGDSGLVYERDGQILTLESRAGRDEHGGSMGKTAGTSKRLI